MVRSLGCTELSQGDTIGVATPGRVAGLIGALLASGIPTGQLAAHFHDMYGQALANTLTPLSCGVTTVDASAGELGGFLFAETAIGNLATKDPVWMLGGLGIRTGMDLRRLAEATPGWQGSCAVPGPSRVVQLLHDRAAPEGTPRMIDFTLSSEHEALRQSVAAFARTEVAPVIGDYYERGAFPYPLVAAMGKMGLFGLPFPEEYGGMGGDHLALCLVLEELARVDSSVAITLEAAVCLGAMPIFRFGTSEQKRQWLPQLCSGEQLAGFGLTEPGGGTDVPGGMRTTAQLADGAEGRQWVVNGSKAFITNAGTDITSLVTVTALTGGGEISAIMIPAGTPGFTVGRKYSKVGWSASDTRELSFADARVPEATLLGPRGRGYAQFLSILDEGRIAIAALSVGLAQGCVDECMRYAGQRAAFGRVIGEYQAIQFKIADMEARTCAARAAYYAAAARLLAGQPVKKDAAIAKLVASNAAMDNARDATQIFGGYGFMNEYPVGRFYRDAKILEIGEGTSEVQRMLIARALGLVVAARA
jgi:short/branched chain acyl-CoA dehydrogenase